MAQPIWQTAAGSLGVIPEGVFYQQNLVATDADLGPVTYAVIAGTLPTGAVLDAASEFAVGDSFDWSVIATGANAFTVTAAATGHTVVGTGAVATVTSAIWRTRKTAADTFVSYRLS